MKTFKFILLALVVSNTITAQKNVRPTKNLDSYEGTWIYQKNDIIFKIKLQKGQEASTAMDKKNRKWTLWRILSFC